ncbi:putative plastoquinol--plastocyanin reductase [Helianthus debilis subsp. tardiflorus]
MIEVFLLGIVLGLIPITLAGLFITAYLQYRRGDQLDLRLINISFFSNIQGGSVSAYVYHFRQSRIVAEEMSQYRDLTERLHEKHFQVRTKEISLLVQMHVLIRDNVHL